MAMTAPTCEKHGAYYAEKCPRCVYEDYKRLSDESKKFFQAHGGREVSEVIEQYHLDMETLYQHFRIRLLEELDPMLREMSRQSREQFEVAYYAAARR